MRPGQQKVVLYEADMLKGGAATRLQTSQELRKDLVNKRTAWDPNGITAGSTSVGACACIYVRVRVGVHVSSIQCAARSIHGGREVDGIMTCFRFSSVPSFFSISFTQALSANFFTSSLQPTFSIPPSLVHLFPFLLSL